ncbi:transcriptional regulator [Exiguobacterium sp. SH31]|uniref:helix-turn-helix domain-containing protein n=1 Tax=unclassified Exiguobacterium TaxID=2644629 RepID=UPI0008C50BB3|nr:MULTISPECIES: helix-turn-helix transcriptional regulator [unclassified Exiguobacterium]OGX78780.1 transcriptional regulator [Exiguobacterium sp. SH31]TCI51936.1 XRE family transcriptional regulator [Exiguobacterium sp. SH1S21]TCI69076.1 XRE family transcriptional regulator [Exiguobacterium sp. SH0S7]
MNQEELIDIVSQRIRLIRLEKEFSQEEMSKILGISKKTLIQIEKGRAVASWNVVVTCVAFFEQSEILQNGLGEDSLEVVRLVTFNHIEEPVMKTLGGKIWWKEVERRKEFRLQQNVVTQHFRIIDDSNYRWFSSFELEEAMLHLKYLEKK